MYSSGCANEYRAYIVNSKNQYKKQFKKWESDLVPKRIKDEQYRAIISKKRKRERAGKTSSAFRWQGAEVKDSNITRFQKRKNVLDAEKLPEVCEYRSRGCIDTHG